MILHLLDKKVTSSHIELNIQNLEQGIYIVKMKTPSARKIIKLIKK
ncbi:MAG: T9SS type A sorting domain-containing protein [Prolixibacteraceae bacterium]